MAVDTGAPSDLRARVEANPLWYHTMALGPGVVTPGWFDLRPIVDRMPWPAVRGKRCLDVGTYDGFLAFELERRGAAEVVATDVSDHDGWDWKPDARAGGPAKLAVLAGPEKGLGFRIAKEALGSSVERLELSIYKLSPERLGSFDVVVCGTLLLHLRDPLGALEAVRSVCRGSFLSAEQIDLVETFFHRRRPLAHLRPGDPMQWWVPNRAGHEEMLITAGFSIERATRPYAVPFGASHPALPRTPRARLLRALSRLVVGGVGVPHSAVLARPRLLSEAAPW
jgi:tRNA (mo5U34)-methyltransferase